MKITLIEPRGFCFGVCRALEMLNALLDQHPIVLHEIVHNKKIIQDYEAKGVRFVENLDDVADGENIVLSAHGVGEETEKNARQRFNVTDTTCPFVSKIHRWVQKLESDNIPIVLIGKPGHAEMLGTLGRIKNPQNVFIVSKTEDVDNLPDMEAVGVAMQTTLSVDDTKQIVQALKNKFKTVYLQNGICQATTERQNAVKEACKTHQMILVVGDEKSSNAKRLVEVAKANGAQSLLIEKTQDLDGVFLPNSIAITSAASAPESLVLEIYQRLKMY
jgi:4-hydroxy-3-methylbut-2-enyl diphosphate reductase